ncbi:alpha/beta hydrolase family protein [Microbulbifer sp. ANSA005]|uniref:alpha/beta hydrolase family protein n=1 Tax=Microbulbifer sp. ANSA005 TaxID=3243362 RepID=UPI004042C536
MRKILFLFFLWPTLVFSSQVPLESLIRHADIEEVKISPTGSHLAIRKLHEGERVLVFMSITPLEFTGFLRFRGKEEVGNFYWANNERVVAEVMSRKAALEAPVNYGSLYAINYDGSKGKNIFGHLAGERQTGTRFKKAVSTYAHATIIDPLPEKKKEILISTFPWARNQESKGEVIRLDIYTGLKKSSIGLPQIEGRAYTDGAGNLLYADGTDKNGNHQLFFREKGKWHRVKNPALDLGTPVGFDAETGDSYLSMSQNAQTEALIKLKPGSENYSTVFQHERSDIDDIIYYPNSYKPLGVYLQPDYPTEYFFDESDGFAPLFRGLKKAFNGFHIKFTSFTTDSSFGVLKVYGDRLPGDYYLVNLKTKSVDFLASSAEWLPPKQLNPMLADTFTTEDGLQVGTYLTFPKGSNKSNPMVVLPHGGPHSRDYWGYDRNAQILSQNGYLVLQVNFRGSTGYGQGFYSAGLREWGGKIQQDIADAVHWAIEKGYADPERICIYGASFGGYSALMNPIRNPDLYQCAVGYVGVYDLEMMYTKGDIKRRDRGISYLKKTLSKDKDFLKVNSPVHNAGKLNLPVFLIHGEEDERAPIEHAEMLVKEFKKENKPIKTLFVKKEGHGFYTEENRMKLYTELLEFLDQHIGIGASEKQSNEG